MDLKVIAYLMRYVFIILLGFSAYHLFVFSFRQLNARIKLKVAPLPGYYLVLEKASGLKPEDLPSQLEKEIRAGHQLLSLPLYPTTIIGKSRYCDLIFKLKNLSRRSVSLYRFDEAWYIRNNAQDLVYVNDVLLTHPQMLKSRDLIKINTLELRFIDERYETHRAGQIYDEEQAESLFGNDKILNQISKSQEEREYIASSLSAKGPWWPYLSLNLLMLFGYYLAFSLLPHVDPNTHRKLLMYIGSSAFLVNFYFLLLPFTSLHFDRAGFLTFAHLMVIGNLVQLRLALINRSQIIAAYINGDHETFNSLIDYVMNQFINQEVAIILGLVIMPVAYLLISRTRLIESLLNFCLVLTPILYILTLILGSDTGGHGARLWLNLGGMSLQLTEFAKVSYLIVLAGFFKIRPRLKQQLAFALWAALNFGLIMLLPDLGSVMILLPTTLVVYVIMTSEFWRALILLIIGSGISYTAYAFFPYVRNRLYGWQSLWTEVNPRNQQIIFGLQAVARGGLWGRGLGNGSPAGIPEVVGDMVYANVCEEWGLIVGLLLVIFYLLIWLRAVYIALESEDGFTAGLVLGVATILFVEAMVVIAGSTGLIPLTGATLPFIAKGGSSMISKFILIALFLGLAGRKNRYNSYFN